MIAITLQTELPGFMVRDKLRDLGLLEGSGEIDDGILRLPAGTWALLDHGAGRVTISIPDDDEVLAARVVIHKVFPNAIEEAGP
jgi:hypothetical protein